MLYLLFSLMGVIKVGIPE